MALVFALSVPFWLLGALAGPLSRATSLSLPVSSLMAICPFLTALILTYRAEKVNGVQRLLKKAFNHHNISGI